LTVKVTMRDGATDEYMRFGAAYVKHNDGTLDVIRTGAKQPYSYATGVWADVEATKSMGKRVVSGGDSHAPGHQRVAIRALETRPLWASLTTNSESSFVRT
jgi:hypothetical protein